MARSPFGLHSFGSNTSGGSIGGNVGAPAAGATAALADATQGIAREMRKMADKAQTQEGKTDALRVIEASREFGQTPQLRQGSGVDDEAYNTVIRQSLLTDMGAEYRAIVQKAEQENPNDPAAFETAVAAAIAPFRQRLQQDPDLAIAFDRDTSVVNMAALSRVRAGQEVQRRDISVAAYSNVAAQGETQLGQVISGAAFDEAGASLVSASLQGYLGQLVKFGPREAFEIGGVQFEADPTRAGTVTATALAQTFDQVQVRTRVSWLTEAANRAPDAAAAAAFVQQVQEQWAAGNPAFVGLSGTDMSQIVNRLEAVVQRRANTEDAARKAAAAELGDLMEAAEYGGSYDAERMRRLAQVSGDPGLAQRVEFGLTHGFGITPASLRSDATGGAGFDGWVNFLLDDLEGPGLVADDNGAGSAQWGITRRSHPEAWADGKVDRNEAARIYRDYWNQIGGDSLPAGLAAAAASFAVVAGNGAARQALNASGGDLERFYAAELAHYEKLARDNPSKYGDDLQGWRNRVEKSRRYALSAAARERASAGFASDPIDFARGSNRREAMADVPEYDINNLFGTDPAGAGAFLRDRLALGQQLNTSAGVPVAIFDKAELATIKERIETDPASIVALTTIGATTAGFGPQGVRVMLRQLGVGGTATADLQLGWLATTETTRAVAAKVVQGRHLRANGARDAAWPEGEPNIAVVTQEAASAFVLQPELTAAVQSLAADMAVADAARGQLKSAAAYVNSALGATNSGNARYGGLSNVNGAVTVAPSWLRHDMMDEALEEAGKLWEQHGSGPLYSNGQRIPARALSRYRMRLAPSGNYRLVTPEGQELAAPSGRAFEFNIDAIKDRMARTYPGSVLGGRR